MISAVPTPHLATGRPGLDDIGQQLPSTLLALGSIRMLVKQPTGLFDANPELAPYAGGDDYHVSLPARISHRVA